MLLKELIEAMENEDWALVRQIGDIRHYQHPENEEIRVTLAGDIKQQLSPGAMAVTGIQVQ